MLLLLLLSSSSSSSLLLLLLFTVNAVLVRGAHSKLSLASVKERGRAYSGDQQRADEQCREAGGEVHFQMRLLYQKNRQETIRASLQGYTHSHIIAPRNAASRPVAPFMAQFDPTSVKYICI